MANDCNQIMCDLGLKSQEDAKKWLLKNHPDKGGKIDSGLFSRATECYKTREFCSPEEEESSMRASASASSRVSSSNTAASDKLLDKSALNKRAKIFSCMRQTENWSKMMPQHKLDNKKFDPNEVEEAIHDASPKLEQLFRIIEQVDKNDMETHGKYFKHFIFSDVKEQGYGAKIIASAFIADGYYNLLEAKKVPNQKALRLSLNETKDDEKDFAFGMLSSTALFKADFNQKFKKQVLNTYNKRPDNIHGENMRFIILDSGFKEGIDLFDVKYVHIFEPSMTIADLKQTIGRATRTCGQKGLNFEPNVGWPLYVYNYYIAIPDEIKEEFKASDLKLLKNPEEEEYLFRNDKLKDAAMIYSQFDKTLTNLAEQLYKLAPVFSVDFALTKNIHRIHDATYLYDMTEQGQGQSALETSSSGGAKSNIKNLDKVNCQGKCGLRSTKDIPATVPFLHKVYLKYGHDKKLLPKKDINDKKYFKLNKKLRAFFCLYMKKYPEYCKQVNTEWANRAAMVPSLVHKRQSEASQSEGKKTSSSIKKAESASYLDVQPNTATPYANTASYFEVKPNTATPYANPTEKTEYLEIEPATTKKKSTIKKKSKTLKIRSNSTLRPKTKPNTEPKSASSLKIANEVMQELQLVPYIKPIDDIEYAIEEYTGTKDLALRQKEPGPPSKRLNFAKMRDFIKTNFSNNFTWDKIVVENKCVEPTKAADAAVKMGGASRIMKLNPTQDFVRTFFTPQSPYKGLLLFHSVGTGKCHALNTPILMHDGSIKMVQDIIEGDKLMGDDSKPRTVLSLARGQDTLYDIIPVKGEKYTVNSEHILCLKYSSTGSISYIKKQPILPYKAAHIDNKTIKVKAKSFATREEAEHYLSQFNDDDRTIEIEVKDYLKLSPSLKRELKGYRKGVEFSHKPVDFDPYIIGLWLGDGSQRGPVITSQDAKILKYLMNEVPKYGLKLVYQSQYDYRISSNGTTDSNALIDALRKYNLLDNKHIPYEYKCTDRANRLLMLAGLIDTDGSYDIKGKCYEITQKSTVLADDILFLARSLGFAAYNKKCNKSWTYNGIKKTNEYNRIHISGNGLEEIPVQLTRKIAEARSQIKDALVSGIKVEKALDLGDYYGFTLDGNCRYLLGDFTVTHNTCSAIATATSTFEKEGYTILWVTRNTLKSDVYKNMFDDVCHIILAERMQRDGLKIPDDPAQRKRLLSKNWIEPISYKTFSNLLTPGGHNVYLDKLIAKNGKADVLRKTLIIIDEAHKLYGGDLKAAERPDMAVMERLLQNSYNKSGKDSARLLIMTATPFTNSPMELFKLINLCKEVSAERIPDDIKEFKANYMGEDNMLSEAGSKKLADKLSGYISYLNREQDPTQFAQPVMIEVPAIMSHLPDNELRQAMFNSNDTSKWDEEEHKIKLKRDMEYIKDLKKELKETQKNAKDKLKARKDRCKTIKNRQEKAKCIQEAEEETEREMATAINEIREEIEKMKNDNLKGKDTIKENKTKVRDMKDKIRNLKDSLLQEIMLVKRCKNVELADKGNNSSN
jgi:hypothetical protein